MSFLSCTGITIHAAFLSRFQTLSLGDNAGVKRFSLERDKLKFISYRDIGIDVGYFVRLQIGASNG